MNFIDISNWQKSIDLATVFAKNAALDGVIVKSTGGVSGVQATCDPWVQWLMANGKPWGFYHYLDEDYRGSTGKAEAEWFVKNTKNYFGHGMPFADYEAQAKSLGTGYLKEFLDTVYSLTGIKAGVYCSLTVVQSQNFSAIASAGYPLWLAQYADMNPTGIQENPWQKGSYAPFTKYIIQQYSSCGQLAGYGFRLDMDKVWLTRAEWDEMVKGSAPSPAPMPTVLKPADPEVVNAVLCNEYGINAERVRKLKEAGYDPDSVQAKINELYAIAAKVKPIIGNNLDYLGCIGQIMRDMR